MSKPVRQHFVTFLSPGTFFSDRRLDRVLLDGHRPLLLHVHESTTKPIGEWHPVTAARMAKAIQERYGATPYGFYFTTCIVAGKVDDGEGGELEVNPKEVCRSGIYFLGGVIRTVGEIEAKADPSERILLLNMKGNRWAACVENTNSYKSIQPFEKEDVLIDWNGKVLARGTDYYTG